jgi:NitT/TauT family transport system ATP-binding protein
MLAAEGVSRAYGPNRVLAEFSLSIDREEIVCLLGPSGCGKTTLLNLFAGLIEPDDGRIRRPAGQPGYVFQEPRLLPWQTAAQNLALGLRARGCPESERRAIVGRYLTRLGLAGAGHLYPHQLSGGMRQRVALGRALAVDPAYLLLDEPFRSLDLALRLDLAGLLLQEWQRRPRPLLFVTHDTAEAALSAQRIVVVGGRPMQVRAELRPPRPPQLRRPGDPDVLDIQARLYALLADDGGG